MKKLSIIIPVYYNEENIEPLYKDIKINLIPKLDVYNVDYELVFIDDGSKDNSFEKINGLKISDPHIICKKLSRNFGSHAAILAGLSVCKGDFAVVKAADLQEPAELIIDMIDEYQKGNDVVLAIRKDRDEPFLQKLFANTYYKIFKKMTKLQMPKGGFDVFLIDRKVIDSLVYLDEKNTALTGQILWCGYKTSNVYYSRKKREIGKSKWTLSKKIKLFEDSIYSFSYMPLQIMGFVGGLIFAISIIWSIVILINKLTNNISVEGYTTLSIIVLLGVGLIMLSLSILGQYLWRMFDATRKRPPFIIDEDNKK